VCAGRPAEYADGRQVHLCLAELESLWVNIGGSL
jgi:hypothetical protein